MDSVLSWIGGGFVVAGVALSLLGAIGVLRFPDFYTRIHAASITDTGGVSLVLLGLCLIAGLTLTTLKLVFVWVFVMLTTPVAANALASAAFTTFSAPLMLVRMHSIGLYSAAGTCFRAAACTT